MALLTLTEIKDYLGETTTDHDAFLNQQNDLFSSAIENYCGRKFVDTSYTQTLYYSDFAADVGISRIYLYHYPFTTITAIRAISRVNGIDTTTVLTSEDYRSQDKKGSIQRTCEGRPVNWFVYDGLSTNGRYEIDFNAGYTDTPLEIKDAMLSLIEERYNRKKSGIALNFGNDVQNISIPGTISIAFDYTLQNNERKNKFGVLLGSYLNVFDFWRSERALIGEIKENYVS